MNLTIKQNTPNEKSYRGSLNNTEQNKNEQNYSLKLKIINYIVNGKIDTFSKLKQIIEDQNILFDKEFISDAFQVIKKLYWGFFAGLSHDKFNKLWKELIITDQDFPEFGDLKKYMQVSEIYIAILDIHGYTKFCQEKKKNISMLQRLDYFLSNQIVKCATNFGVLANRERGDEVVLVGASAIEILSASFEIIELFSKSKKISSAGEISSDIFLPEFKISAGIAGGQPSIPLIITERGNLSGFLINSAARLQGRANTISPNETIIMVEQYVMLNYTKNGHNQKGYIDNLQFFYNGEIDFKGVSLNTYEVFTFVPEHIYKIQIEKAFIELQDMIKDNQWHNKVLTSLCDLVILTSRVIEPFNFCIEFEGHEIKINNNLIIQEFTNIKNIYSNINNFNLAMEKLCRMCDIINRCAGFDKLVAEYCRHIYQIYQKPFEIYNQLFTQYIHENKTRIFSIDELKIFDLYSQIQKSFDKLMEHMHNTENVKEKRLSFWFRAIELAKDKMDFSIHSGKK